MHQRRHNSIRALRWARRGLGAGLALAATACVISRTDAVARRPIERALERVEYGVNGRISFQRVRPVGLAGVALEGVEVRPHAAVRGNDDLPVVTIERVVAHPDLRSLLRGEPSAESVALEGLHLGAVVDAGRGAHADWLRWLVNEIQLREAAGSDALDEVHGTEPRAPDRADGPSRLRQLIAQVPKLDVVDASASFDDRSGQLPSVGARAEHISFDPGADDGAGSIRGRITVEGLGRGAVSGSFEDGVPSVALTLLDANDLVPLLPAAIGVAPNASVSVESVHLDWPPRLSLGNVRVTELDVGMGGATRYPLSAVEARRVTLTGDGAGAALHADGIDLLFGDRDARFAVDRAAVRRPWTGAVSAEAALLDREGDAIVARVGHDDDGLRVDVEAARYDFRPIAEHLPALDAVRPVAGSVSGTGALTFDDGGAGADVELALRLDALAVDAPLASHEVLRDINVEVVVDAHVEPDARVLQIRRGRVAAPALGAIGTVQGEITPAYVQLDAAGSIRRQPAQQLLDALPRALSDALVGFRLSGEFAAEAALTLDTRALTDTEASFDIDYADMQIVSFGPLAPVDRLLDPDFVWHTRTFDGTRLRLGPGTETWTPLATLPTVAYRAIVAAEDDRFWIHDGFDARAIVAAITANVAAGDVVRGGSTISQQVVKNMFLNHDRTLARKLQEAFLTWQLEQHLTKAQILEYYVNLAHWGPNTYGIDAAAEAYFDHAASQLTLRESAFLAAILPNPTLFGGQYLEGEISPSRRTKMSNVLANLAGAGFLSPETLAYHRALVLDGRVSDTPPPRELGVHAAPTASAPAATGTAPGTSTVTQ